MATKLVLTMETAGGDKNFTYAPANADTTTARVKALGAGLITYGSLFENVPTAFKAAKLVTTTEAQYDISE